MQTYATWWTATWQVRMNIVVYYLQRLVTIPMARRGLKRALIFVLRIRHRDFDRGGRTKLDSAIDLDNNGVAFLGRLLSEEDCVSIRQYLSSRSMKDVRGTGSTFDIHAIPHDVKLGDFPLTTVVNCPKIMQIANCPELLSVATDYLGFTPTITNISLRWSFPTEVAARDIQQYHRDCEPANVKIMIYLTDVDLDCGPHVYIPRTHKERKSIRLHTYSNDEVNDKYGDGMTITGPAGTAFVIDPSGIHKGVSPRRFPRLLLSIQYSLLPALIYNPKPVRYDGETEFNAYINRLIVSFDEARV